MCSNVRQLRFHPTQNSGKTGFSANFCGSYTSDCISMSTIRGPLLTPDSPNGSGIKISKKARHYHPKKSHLKRHLEQENDWNEKVLVQSVHSNGHSAKKLKSDWDLLFYNHEFSKETDEKQTTIQIPAKTGERACPTKKDRQSFLVRGKEMRSFFRLIGVFVLTLCC